MLIFFAVFKSFLAVNIFQQAHYHIEEYLIHMLKNIFYYSIIPFIFYLLSYIPNLYNEFLIVIDIYGILFLFFKKRLCLTKRILVQIVLIIPFYFLLFIDYGNIFILFFEYIMIIPFLLENIIFKIINKKYLKNAKNKLKNYNNLIIGVTGSCGKTTVKDFLSFALGFNYSILSTPKSFNTPLGIAKTINNSNPSLYDFLIVEMGVSHKNDMNKLLDVVKPDIAIITEIAYMHMQGFKSIEDVYKEKIKIVKNAKIVILNYENEFLRNYNDDNKIIISYGYDYGIYQAHNIINGEFDLYKNSVFIKHFITSLNGKHSILNTLPVIALLDYYNVDFEQIYNIISLLKNSENRMEIKSINGHMIINDSYNSNPLGFKEALMILKKEKGKHILITPGIVELGKYRRKIFEDLVPYIVSSCDIVIIVKGENDKLLKDLLSKYNIELYTSVSFNSAYRLYKSLIKKEEVSALLIENDLPDLYRRGLINW